MSVVLFSRWYLKRINEKYRPVNSDTITAVGYNCSREISVLRCKDKPRPTCNGDGLGGLGQ